MLRMTTQRVISMEIKGVAIQATKQYIIERFGEKEFLRWLDALSPDAKKVYSGDILSSLWYPLTPICSLPRQKMCDLFHGGDVKGCIGLGEYSARFSLTGVYKMFIRVTTKNYLVNKVAQTSSLYYRPSRYMVVSNEEKRVIIHIEEFPEPHKAIEYTNLGYLKGALEICGYEGVKVALTKSLADGDAYSELIVSFL